MAIPPQQAAEERCVAILKKASEKVGGEVVRYATRYNRDRRSSSSRSVEVRPGERVTAIETGLPNDGWIVVTKSDVSVFTRTPLTEGIGSYRGTIPTELLAAVSIEHGRKQGKATIMLTFIDGSTASLVSKTRDSYPALSIWAQTVAEDAAEFEAELLADGPIFDHDALDLR